MTHRVRIWDLPTRLFHWALLFCVVSLFVTVYRGDIEWHARMGYAVLTLLLFRLIWGFVGGHWSRFRSFLYAPSSVVTYLKGRAPFAHGVGHNPLGAGSVFAMLAVLLAQVATGLFSDDEIAFTGPLNRFIATSKALALTWYHKQVGQWLIVALVALHVAAILYYTFRKKDSLVGPMLVGDKTLEEAAPASRDDWASRGMALVVFGACAGFVWWLVGLGSSS